MTYRVEPLGEHDLRKFYSGNSELDEWLRRHASTATGQRMRTHLMVKG